MPEKLTPEQSLKAFKCIYDLKDMLNRCVPYKETAAEKMVVLKGLYARDLLLPEDNHVFEDSAYSLFSLGFPI
ncbi:MAG: hypothetical protein ACD_5C00213G0006 [uncultured bacterium]|nr:MAG: hypothetical protein ACD_5C00213G0006 [uncultured bacterium]